MINNTLLACGMSSNGHHISLDAVQAAIERACAEFEVSSLFQCSLEAPAALTSARQS